MQRNVCHFLIDSLSALQALESSQIKNNLVVDILYKLRILKTLDIDVYFEWIPSHCGVQGNEIADKLAKKGSSKEIIELEIPYIKEELVNHMSSINKEKWQFQWEFSLNGRHLWQIQSDVKKYKKYSRS